MNGALEKMNGALDKKVVWSYCPHLLALLCACHGPSCFDTLPVFVSQKKRDASVRQNQMIKKVKRKRKVYLQIVVVIFVHVLAITAIVFFATIQVELKTMSRPHKSSDFWKLVLTL